MIVQDHGSSPCFRLDQENACIYPVLFTLQALDASLQEILLRDSNFRLEEENTAMLRGLDHLATLEIESNVDDECSWLPSPQQQICVESQVNT